MAKWLKVIFIILGVLILLGVIIFIAGTQNMDAVRGYTIPEIDMRKIGDGDYEGLCDIGRWAINVKVTVKDHRISKVIITDRLMSNITDDLLREINQHIINLESPDFDAVTSATLTSKGYMIAVADALYKGMK